MNDSPKAEKRPDFAEVLDALQQENAKLQEATEKAFYFTNQLKDCRQPEPKSESEIQKEPQGVVEFLWLEVRKLKRSNETLQQSNRGLSGIIGS